jgi:acetoin utilization protein AcuB
MRIEDFMSHPVQAIGLQQPLAEAHRVMNALHVRHLAVRMGGRLVGVVSQRDLHLLETLRDVDPRDVPVEEAMTRDVLTVEVETPLQEVARQMLARRCGSALVTRDGDVVGIFTTVDALRALEALLGAGRPAPAVR